MKHRFILFAFILCAAEMAGAQNLSVFNLDATNFPTLKANFYAFDANGQQQSPSASEITVTEDGIRRTVTNITCPPKKDPAPISLGIMVDTYSGIDLAKEGAQKLINLLSIPPSEAGITMMDHGAFIVQDLTQKTVKLTTAIAKLQPAPGVDLETMFYAPNAGGVPFVSAGTNNKKILMLITDLHCPTGYVDKAKLFADCLKENISVYIILLNTRDEMGYSKEITDKTGGLLFEDVKTSADIDQLILYIYPFINNFSPCEISWQSDTTCSIAGTNVDFAWQGGKSDLTYGVASNLVAQIQFSPAGMYILSKPIGQKFDTTITLTALNASFNVTDIISTNPLYDVNPKNFFLSPGQSKKLIISYTPHDSSYTWTRFDIQNTRCVQSFYASGTYVKRGPAVPTIKLVKPNGGEVLIAGSDTIITWTGIPLIDTVRLEYSLDDGNTWNTITDKATGGKYIWHVPNSSSNQCLAKVTQLISSKSDSWVREGGSPSTNRMYNDMGSSITVDTSGNIYATGYFSGTADFSGIKLTSKRGIDIFIIKYHPDGKIEWAEQAAGIQSWSGAPPRITTDRFGNIFLTGFFDTIADFGGITLNGEGVEDVFLAKYHSDGSVEWAKRMGGIHTDDESGITTDSSGNIYLKGFFIQSADFDTINLTNPKGNGNYFSIFLAKYRSNGTIEWAKAFDNASDGGRGGGIALDATGNIYITDLFRGTLDLGGKTISTSGLTYGDLFVAKFTNDGNIIWVKSAGGKTGENVQAIVTDAFGNIYITGTCSDSANFDNIFLPKGGMFVAKYHPDGTVEWVKQNDSYLGTGLAIDGEGNIYASSYGKGKPGVGKIIHKYHPDGRIDWTKNSIGNPTNALGIAIDLANNNIYATGTFVDTGIFEGIKLSPIGQVNIFVWKINDDILQSDTSDAVFSIVAPTFSFASNIIDMGQVETGTEKDSVVKATICNSGAVPLHVLGMDITGGDKAEFMIMSGAGDFTLKPGECRDVMFTYMPMMTGKMYATVTLRTSVGNYADTIKILGEGIAPLLAVMGNVIDFGQVKIGSYKDTTIVIGIENIGKTTVNFLPATQLGPDVKQFSLQSSAAGFTLPAGATQSISLRFTPSYIGRTSGRIGFGYNGPSTPAIMNVYGQGIGGLVSITDDSGHPGDHKYIPLILQKVPVSSVQSLATNFSARVAYDNSVLQPNSSLIQKGNLFDTLNISGSLTTSDTLSFIPFTVLLGERTISSMNIVDFHWLDGAGNTVDYDVETKSGTFTVTNSCGDSLLRNFMLTGKIAAITSISPNPSKSITHIEIQTTEKGRTQLEVMNLLGLSVATIFGGELQTGSHSFDFKTSDLPSGSYFLVMTTPSVRKMARIDVAK